MNLNVYAQDNAIKMVKIPGMNIKMLSTEVTQNLYASVMKDKYRNYANIQYNLPVNYITIYQAMYFCNKLSEMNGLKPVYSVNKTTDVSKWIFNPEEFADDIKGKIQVKRNADGYRLPTVEEWLYAANAGETYLYSGSNDIEEVAWYKNNSSKKIHEVGLKNPNEYGLYDMSGNVSEWCWDWPLYIEFNHDEYYEFIPTLGGSFKSNEASCMLNKTDRALKSATKATIGFRIVCLDKE